MTPFLINFLQDPRTLMLITEAMLLAIAVVSLAIFLVMATFRGKSPLDWTLLFREFALFLVTSRLFAIIAFDWEAVPLIQAATYSMLAVVCAAVLFALVREHVFYPDAPSLAERWKRLRA